MRLHDYISGVRWIQYSPDLAKVFSPTGSILLCWVIWKSHDQGGPVRATYAEISEQTGLSERNIETAKELLQGSGVLEVTSRRLEHSTFYSVNPDKLEEVWAAFPERPKRPLAPKAETVSPERPKRPLEASIRTGVRTGKEQDGATALALGAGLLPSGSGGVDPTGGKGSPEGEAFSLSALSSPQVAPPSPFVAFKTGWFDRFKLRTGEKYDFKAADGVALKRMLDSNSAESLLNLVDRCEDAPNDSAHWSCKRALETVAKFSSLLNSVRCELAAKPMTRPVVRSVPEPHAIREEVAVPVMRF